MIMTNKVDLLRELEELHAQNERWSEAFNECMSYQRRGMDCEKANDFSGAIAAYTQCVAYNETVEDVIGSLRCLHSIERLAIIYRKLKLYEEEQNILEYALKHELSDVMRVKLGERYSKLMMLQSKSVQK